MAKHTLQNLKLVLHFLFVSLSSYSSYGATIPANPEGKIKGMFVFGSSVVDSGNNNFIQNSLAKVNYLPYGVDFPLGPSGRFSNGKNVIDWLGEKLKLPDYIPPFADPSTKGQRIVHGVNYASGGSGILDDTGALAGGVISLNEQIRNFENVSLPELQVKLGLKRIGEALPEYLFFVGTGGNDYSLNFFNNMTSKNVTLEAFTADLIARLSYQLKRLYKLGARKFVLMGINPNGCAPNARARFPSSGGSSDGRCVQTLNRAVNLFNTNLKMLVDTIRPQMPGSNLVFLNAYKIIRDIIKDPASQGFSDVKNPCCEVDGLGFLCKRGGSICKDRKTYAYFDGLHVTETVHAVLAAKAYASNLQSHVYPFNVNLLSRL